MIGGLARKILLPNLILLVLQLCVLGYLFLTGRHNRTELVRATDALKRQNSLLVQLNNIRRERQKAILSYRFDTDPAHLQTLAQTEGTVQEIMRELKAGMTTDRERRLMDAILRAREKSFQSRRSLFEAVDKGNEPEIQLAYTRLSTQLAISDALFADLTTLTVKALDQNIALNDRERAKTLLTIGILVCLVALLTIIFSLLIRKHFVKPVQEMTRTAHGIAAGNLGLRVTQTAVSRNDEIGTLARAFNEMTESLAKTRRDLEASIGELSRSNSDLEQFAYVSSHDLKEPLRMMSLYAQLLEKEVGPELDKKTSEYLEHIVDSARRMQNLINDLLVYSRVSGLKEKTEVIDLNRVVVTAKEDLRSIIQEGQATITCEPLPRVMGHRTQLVQLFENLISNAIKFHGDQKPQVHIGCERENGHWVVSVKDNGIGIRPEYKDKIFIIFQRLHTRKEYPGTGIGLAVCKKIAERGGGKIWVDSAPGQGSTFRVSFPHAQAAPPV